MVAAVSWVKIIGSEQDSGMQTMTNDNEEFQGEVPHTFVAKIASMKTTSWTWNKAMQICLNSIFLGIAHWKCSENWSAVGADVGLMLNGTISNRVP